MRNNLKHGMIQVSYNWVLHAINTTCSDVLSRYKLQVTTTTLNRLISCSCNRVERENMRSLQKDTSLAVIIIERFPVKRWVETTVKRSACVNFCIQERAVELAPSACAHVLLCKAKNVQVECIKRISAQKAFQKTWLAPIMSLFCKNITQL